MWHLGPCVSQTEHVFCESQKKCFEQTTYTTHMSRRTQIRTDSRCEICLTCAWHLVFEVLQKRIIMGQPGTAVGPEYERVFKNRSYCRAAHNAAQIAQKFLPKIWEPTGLNPPRPRRPPQQGSARVHSRDSFWVEKLAKKKNAHARIDFLASLKAQKSQLEALEWTQWTPQL